MDKACAIKKRSRNEALPGLFPFLERAPFPSVDANSPSDW